MEHGIVAGDIVLIRKKGLVRRLLGYEVAVRTTEKTAYGYSRIFGECIYDLTGESDGLTVPIQNSDILIAKPQTTIEERVCMHEARLSGYADNPGTMLSQMYAAIDRKISPRAVSYLGTPYLRSKGFSIEPYSPQPIISAIDRISARNNPIYLPARFAQPN